MIEAPEYYVVYRMDRYPVGSGYYMPLDVRVYTDLKKAKRYIQSQGYLRDAKQRGYNMLHYSPADAQIHSRYIIETITARD